MKNFHIFALSLIIFAGPRLTYADTSGPGSLCERTRNSKEFVQGSLAICLADSPSQRAGCMRDAEQAFNACGYKGNFLSMSQRHQAKIIMLSLFKNMVALPKSTVGLASNASRDQ